MTSFVIVSKNTLKDKYSEENRFQGYFSEQKIKRKIIRESSLISGFLWIKKQSFIKYSWKLYWFVLTNKYELKYYTKSDLKTLKGSIDLLKSNIMDINLNKKCEYDKLNGLIKSKIKTFPFILKFADKIEILRAQTEFDRSQFIYYLKNIMVYKNKFPVWSMLSINHDISKINNKSIITTTNDTKMTRSHCETNNSHESDRKYDDINDASNDSNDGSMYLIDIYNGEGLLQYPDFTQPSTYVQISYQFIQSK